MLTSTFHRNDRKIVATPRIGWEDSFAEGRGSLPKDFTTPHYYFAVVSDWERSSAEGRGSLPKDHTTPTIIVIDYVGNVRSRPPAAPRPLLHSLTHTKKDIGWVSVESKWPKIK